MSKETKEVLKYISPTIKTSDETLLEVLRSWRQEAKKYYEEMSKTWVNNEKYYLGRQTEQDKVPSDMADTVHNHIFTGVETIVPIASSNPPQFVAEPPEESEVSDGNSDKLQKLLHIYYELLKVKEKGEQMLRHMIVYRAGIWKVGWDEVEKNISLEVVRPQRIYIPKVQGELPYLMEKKDITAEEFKDIWGEAKLKELIKKEGGLISKVFDRLRGKDSSELPGIFPIWEVWTPKIVIWASYDLNMLIEKRENPYYDFEEIDKNHFTVPKIPYIFSTAFRLGSAPYGETDLIQQAIPIQDEINVLVRRILDNANKTGNSQWFVDSSVMSEEEANSKITNSPGLIIMGDGVANPSLMRRDPPVALPSYIQNMKVMAESAFDNVFGTHSTTRGERSNPETLGGRMLLKQADFGRIDLLVREYEKSVGELGNWIAQLLKLYIEDSRIYRYFGETGTEYLKYSSEMIESGVRILVKPGTTLPTDEISKREEALQLWSLQAIDPITLFERLKFPDPEGAAQALVAWQNGQLVEGQKTPEEEAELEMEAKNKQRGVETPRPQGREQVNEARQNLMKK